jgi:hypothetical protein
MPISTEPQIARFSAPIGTVFMTLEPRRSNWLPCNGAGFEPELYQDLSNLLKYSIGDVTPDMQPRDREGNVLELSPGDFSADYGGTYVPHYIVAKIM